VLAAVWLASARTPSGAASSPSIVVLPFEQYSADARDAALASRLTSGVTTELARLGTLSVVSHTTARQYEGARRPLREIAAAVHARFVMEAMVEADGEGWRVQARLVDASTDRKFWVQDFRVAPATLRDIERQMAAAVNAVVLGR
jgi:TolB-like protein